MRNIIIHFALCFFTINTECQPIITDAGNKRIMEWDTSCQTESKYFRSNSFFETAYYHAIRKQNKLVAEYFRHDDSSYLFVKYDTSEWVTQRGLLKYTNEYFDCQKIEIQDYARDPEITLNITKDTMLCEGSFRKNGIWWERDSLGMIWKGEYKNGLKEGRWLEGIRLHVYSPEGYIIERQNDYFRPYIQHDFKNGMEISQYKDSSFWPAIKGKWFLDMSLNTTTVILHRSGRHLVLNFKTTSKVSFPAGSNRCFDCFDEYISPWKKENDFIKIDEAKKVFKILKLTDDELIIRFIQW